MSKSQEPTTVKFLEDGKYMLKPNLPILVVKKGDIKTVPGQTAINAIYAGKAKLYVEPELEPEQENDPPELPQGPEDLDAPPSPPPAPPQEDKAQAQTGKLISSESMRGKPKGGKRSKK